MTRLDRKHHIKIVSNPLLCAPLPTNVLIWVKVGIQVICCCRAGHCTCIFFQLGSGTATVPVQRLVHQRILHCAPQVLQAAAPRAVDAPSNEPAQRSDCQEIGHARHAVTRHGAQPAPRVSSQRNSSGRASTWQWRWYKTIRFPLYFFWVVVRVVVAFKRKTPFFF